MRKKIIILFLVIAGTNFSVFAQLASNNTSQADSNWSMPLQIQIRDNVFDLKIGCQENATGGFDSGIDVMTAPPAFDPYAFLFIDAFPNFLSEDYRSPAQEHRWTLRIVKATSDSSSILWNVSELAEGDELFLNDTINMIVDTTAKFYGIQNITITYRPQIVSVEQPLESLTIRSFKLYQNYPNPFNAQTVIKYQLPEAGKVSLNIYNFLGQKVKTLINKEKPAGYYKAFWDGRNHHGNLISSGLYFYRIEAGEFSSIKKMLILK